MLSGHVFYDPGLNLLHKNLWTAGDIWTFLISKQQISVNAESIRHLFIYQTNPLFLFPAAAVITQFPLNSVINVAVRAQEAELCLCFCCLITIFKAATTAMIILRTCLIVQSIKCQKIMKSVPQKFPEPKDNVFELFILSDQQSKTLKILSLRWYKTENPHLREAGINGFLAVLCNKRVKLSIKAPEGD